MALPWFRMYAEFATDTKVQSMDETFQRRFTMFLCLHCSGEYERLSEDELAFALRITVEQLRETKQVFERKGFIDADGKIRNWNKRQYKSDNSTSRVQKHRSKKKETGCNGDETFQERPQIQIQKIRTKNVSSASPPKQEPVWAEDFKRAYPERSGDSNWRGAWRAASARIAEGHAPEEFIAGARRYAEFVRATGKENTEFVKQASTFLGPSKPFLEPWRLPERMRPDRPVEFVC